MIVIPDVLAARLRERGADPHLVAGAQGRARNAGCGWPCWLPSASSASKVPNSVVEAYEKVQSATAFS